MSAVDRICKKVNFPFAPFPYQRDEVNARVEDCIDHVNYFWDMGAGKTAGSTMHNMIYRDQIGAQVIQIVPPILLKQWHKWLNLCGIANKVYAGSPKERAAITFDRDTPYFLMSIEVLKRDFERITTDLGQRKIMVCVDEATSIKGYDSGNFRAVLQLSSGQGIMPMTGTPLSTPADAYAYIKLVSPGVYRSFTQFENIHVESRDYFGSVTAWQNLDLLKKNLAQRASFVSTPEAHPDMPRARVSEWEYDLEKQHTKLYRTLADQQLLLLADGGAIDASTPNKLYHALQQVVLNYGYFAQNYELVPTGFAVLDELIAELGKKKIVIFANYKMSVRAIMQHLEKRNVVAVQVNGDVSQRGKDGSVERFKEDKDCQAIVMNPQSGGVGIDGLQHVCHTMIFMEVPTLSKSFWQAVKRLERPGQKNVVDVRIGTALGTIQVHLRKKLVENDGLINEVVPSMNDLRAALLGK